ncbi:MAG: undecaprenyldiphospho-muramoylpentapeptide beta-N-acetylglucosaminyltransferase [Cyclobacteriaceae bacterium]
MTTIKRNEPLKIIISGGGTGGHIYPAIAIANALKTLADPVDILFVGAKDRMEMQKVPEAGYPIIGLWISGIQRKLSLSNLLFPIKLLASLFRSKKILKRFKPNAVVGVGGYASGPLLYAATQKKVPALIQEQNSYAGLANKWLSKKVQKICVAYDNMEAFFPSQKLVYTGNPVRLDILSANSKRPKAIDFFGLSPERKTILIIGGSLGARTINHSIEKDLAKIINAGVQLIWQTGRFYFREVEQKLAGIHTSQVHLFEFLREMDLAYAAADLVISRAGALSIAELCLVGKPVVFVPSPNVAEDHQTKNAMALVSKNAAIMVKDHKAKEQLVDHALELLQDDAKQEELRINISRLGKPDAAITIAKEILKLAS